MSSSTTPVWFITGCSAGLGLAIARTVLAQGHHVIASSRNPSKTPELVEEITGKGGHWVTLDVTSKSVKQTIDSAIDIYGRLDVVVNNAGFAVIGPLEDADESSTRAQFDTNVFGALNVMQAVLPSMRQSRSGTIVNISSRSGLTAHPAFGLYAASKHALEALSESLSQEVAAFGVRVLLVEPGMFRTNFLGQDAIGYGTISEAYKGTSADQIIGMAKGSNGTQSGDPDKAANRIFEVVMGEGMAKGRKKYLRLVLGTAALQGAKEKLDQVRENLDALEDISTSTEFD